MEGFIKSKLNLKVDFYRYYTYKEHVTDLTENEKVISMDKYIQHSDVTCLEHCLLVSYYSYKICKFLKFDYKSAARGGLLHDFFLYDWHEIKPKEGLHGFVHSNIALKNAKKYFKINDVEADIIGKHMWPLTSKLPKYKEAFVVMIVDKICAIFEIIKIKKTPYKYKINRLYSTVFSKKSLVQ
jgi:uncharacterized protein